MLALSLRIRRVSNSYEHGGGWLLSGPKSSLAGKTPDRKKKTAELDAEPAKQFKSKKISLSV